MSVPMGAHNRRKDITQLLSTIVLLLLPLFLTTIDCNSDYAINDRSDGVDDNDGQQSVKDMGFTGDGPQLMNVGVDVIQKLIKHLGDGNNAATAEISPKADPLMPKKHSDDLLDFDDLLSGNMKVHMHHVFPPHLIRPLQKAIIKKLIHKINRDPTKIFKRKFKKVARVAKVSTLAVGLGIGFKEIKELKSRPPIAHYSVTGLEDLSAKKSHLKGYKRERRDDNIDDGLYDVTKDSGDPDYKTVRDYKLIDKSHGKHHWPFDEGVDEIHEKWNKFPAPVAVDPFHQKVKYIHRSFHELGPDLHHLIQDVNGLVGTKTKVIHTGPELESPIVLAGQALKLLDSLIPSIRIRIPFVEYLVKSFFEKSKPKVVYVKQKPRVKYVGVPYDSQAYDSGPMPGQPIQVNVPITVPMAEPVVVPERSPEQNGYQRVDSHFHGPQSRPHFYDSNNNHHMNVGYENNVAFGDNRQQQHRPTVMPLINFMSGQSGYDSHTQTPPGALEYHNMNEQYLRVYEDKKGGKA